MFWKTRWEPSTDGRNTPNRTLVSYKDTHFDDAARTRSSGPAPGATRASRPPADDVTPENALTGQSFVVNSGTSAITVPSPTGSLRLWRNTAVATPDLRPER